MSPWRGSAFLKLSSTSLTAFSSPYFCSNFSKCSHVSPLSASSSVALVRNLLAFSVLFSTQNILPIAMNMAGSVLTYLTASVLLRMRVAYGSMAMAWAQIAPESGQSCSALARRCYAIFSLSHVISSLIDASQIWGSSGIFARAFWRIVLARVKHSCLSSNLADSSQTIYMLLTDSSWSALS